MFGSPERTAYAVTHTSVQRARIDFARTNTFSAVCALRAVVLTPAEFFFFFFCEQKQEQHLLVNAAIMQREPTVALIENYSNSPSKIRDNFLIFSFVSIQFDLAAKYGSNVADDLIY